MFEEACRHPYHEHHPQMYPILAGSGVLDGLWFPLALAQTVVILVVGLYARFESRLQQVQSENEELAALRDRLPKESQRKSDFLATMSHELRTPLTGVIGFAEVLEEGLYGELNEAQERAARDIKDSGQHLLILVNDILDLSKIEAGRAELELSTFSVELLVEDALTVVAEPARQKNLHLAPDLPADIPADIPLTVTADRRRIKQVLYNYLSNAVKFSEPDTTITVSVTRHDDEVRFEVRDQGVGIDPDHLDRLFKRFSQVDSSDVRKYEGTGLGLALVKLLVDLHNGRVWVSSTLGEGSTFGFALPRQPVKRPRKNAPRSEETGVVRA